MRNYLCLALCLITGLLSAQTVDSVALRRVDSLIQVSRALTNKKEFNKALEVNGAAEKLALEKFGQKSAPYGSCAHNHGRILYNMGDYPNSLKHYLEAKAIRSQALGVGKEHPNYAITLQSLATVYVNLGLYSKAEPLFLEAKDIREKTVGKEHIDYVSVLSSLSNLYYDMAVYEKAEFYYLDIKTILEKVSGKENPNYAGNLLNLAAFYWAMGNYEKAETYFLEAKGIYENLPNQREHYNYGYCLINLANLYWAIGNYAKAKPLYLEALAILEKAVGKEHPNYAMCLDNLAILEQTIGNYEKAESLYLEALDIRGKVLGNKHNNYADNLNNLAKLYAETGRHEKAEQIYLEALVIQKNTVGKEHPNYVECLDNLAILEKTIGKPQKAVLYFAEAATARRSLLSKAVRYLSEQETGNYLNRFSRHQDELLAFVNSEIDKDGSQKSAAVCFDNALFYKGFLLQATGQIKLLSLSDSTAAKDFSRLKLYQRRLAAQYAQPIAVRDSALIVDLEAKANNLEKDLARTVAGFGQAIQQVKWQEVQAALEPGEAAVEFVSYRFYQKRQTDSTMYAALVLLPGTDEPKFIPLFEEKQLTTLLKTEGSPQPTFYNDLYSVGKKGDQLYDLIWKPIAAALPQGTTVYCSPSGLLHRINLGAIPTPDGKTLAEKNRLSMLGSTRQLVVPPVSITQQSATAQLYGGIQYDATPTLAINTPTKPEDLATRRGPSIAQNDSTLRGGNWNYLRWTEVEISAAANVMKSKGIVPILKKGAEATEESFKALGQGNASPRILHVATHGFFFPDPKELKPGEGQAIGEKTFKVSDNPMIRSGLVLAGGNHAWKTGKPLRPDLEDGILTAYEISQMNLANTELVVLSACETGLGDLVGNEGVYGLQRAFKIAGAKYLVMSLWQVPDFQTQVFMTAFYKNWLEGKMAVPEAFRATQAELRGKYSGEAFKWAGFVLVE
jgi:CHAT domain-containing protein/tetratricopeptide (TPR) repeat protein